MPSACGPRLPSLQARLACRAGMAATTAGVANGFVQGNLAILPEKLAGVVSPLLPAQPETLSDHRHVRCRRPPHSLARHRSRYPHRPAALPGLARRRGGGGADRHHVALARRSRRLRARLLVFVRGSADGRRPADPPHRAQACACRCTAPISPASRRGRSRVPWWCRCGRSSRRDAIRAVQITSRFPAVHGAPVHLGHPHSIGIADIAKPDYGDPVPVERRRDSRCSGPAASPRRR